MSYPLSVLATTNVTFNFSGQPAPTIADGIQVLTPCQAITIHKVDGSTIDLSAVGIDSLTVGTVIMVPCTKVVFSGGVILALRGYKTSAALNTGK